MSLKGTPNLPNTVTYVLQGSCHSKFNRAPVCGVDGVTYSSHCDAANFLVLVDYKGQCVSDQDELRNCILISIISFSIVASI